MKSVVVHAAVVAAVVSLAGAPAAAAEPVLHHVKYTVGASEPMQAVIYYRDTQPPSWADYSHNPYVFSPKAEAELGPGKPWVLEAMLADPNQWAMVVATTPPHTPPLAEPGFVCELRVDDVVVATDAGPKGALCSLRTW
ncbi:hypothetical protein [Mycolicibacterium bacteremicum]|uniref:Secreted protein n=1 Tax=Mycolicibacterium bacteremicum TaxID=564198 RepID=A0A1W9YZF8_MYCBA|nr:hypothetical protein [Mycolicibacterium bacteremicum]MCV7431394.1 hypothetical protein [Mycolicibacterium bacteremicum]ORA05160.1 hypothetical protein BST17_10880 [Mycolicibacterium bacteremicum]